MLKERYSGWRYFGSLLFVIEAGILTLYMVIATNLSPLIGAEAPATMVIIVISVLAMSLHNVHSLQVMPDKAQIAITGLFWELRQQYNPPPGFGTNRQVDSCSDCRF